jgi:CubicO group peptidase (beta-lactamase class C family)
MGSEQIESRFTRRSFVQATVAGAAAVTLPARAVARPASRGSMAGASQLFAELDARIEAGMAAYGIPGVAVGVLYRGREYLKGYGVTNVDYPKPVDPDTVFRIGSTTKTFTGTTVMRLVEQGKLDLDARVRRYLPDFRTSDPTVAPRVTVRQLLNHSPGWMGDYLQGYGRGDDALARYVAGIARIPQLTPLGEVFFYNNPALCVAGRLIEVVTRETYEQAVRSLLIDPLGLAHSRFFSDEIIGFNIAASHNNLVDGKPVVDPSFWEFPRSLNPTGGLISSVRDQLAYARFHLGDGRAPDGKRLLTPRSLERMRSHPGPGGTMLVELEGMGVSWMLRPSSQGVRIVQHGGTWSGQHSGFMMVPEQGFALTALTNSDGGIPLIVELFDDDWALRTFTGLSNLPAVPRVLSRSELAPYEGRYENEYIATDGKTGKDVFELRGHKGGLRATAIGEPPVLDPDSGTPPTFVFYRKDYVLVLNQGGRATGPRANFLRDGHGRVKWLRSGGRLYRHQP